MLLIPINHVFLSHIGEIEQLIYKRVDSDCATAIYKLTKCDLDINDAFKHMTYLVIDNDKEPPFYKWERLTLSDGTFIPVLNISRYDADKNLRGKCLTSNYFENFKFADCEFHA